MLSFPLAYGVRCLVFGVRSMAVLDGACPFIVLGIAVDDALLFSDIVNQRVQHELAIRNGCKEDGVGVAAEEVGEEEEEAGINSKPKNDEQEGSRVLGHGDGKRNKDEDGDGGKEKQDGGENVQENCCSNHPFL